MTGTELVHAGFSLTLHRHLSAGESGNTVCSPWSVSTALAVLTAGADEPTRATLTTALAAGESAADLVSALAADASAVAEGSPADDESVLTTANTLWVDEARTPTRSFTEALGGWPGSAVRPAPIARDPEGARGIVNADVDEATRGLVPEILPPESITSVDRAVLVNTLYVLAGWVQRFDSGSTADGTFRSPGGPRQVPMLRGVREIPYAATGGWRYAALPLGANLNAELLLPDADLAPAEAALDGPDLVGLRRSAADALVTLTMPRFRVEGGGDLEAAMVALGLGRLFDDQANPLPHVLENDVLFLSSAFHRGVLRVDEQGVEGGAATALVMTPAAFRVLPEVELTLDRPFLVLVTHRATGAVLFVARVVDPASSP